MSRPPRASPRAATTCAPSRATPLRFRSSRAGAPYEQRGGALREGGRGDGQRVAPGNCSGQCHRRDACHGTGDGDADDAIARDHAGYRSERGGRFADIPAEPAHHPSEGRIVSGRVELERDPETGAQGRSRRDSAPRGDVLPPAEQQRCALHGVGMRGVAALPGERRGAHGVDCPHGSPSAVQSPGRDPNAGVPSGRRKLRMRGRATFIAHCANARAAGPARDSRTTYRVYGLVSAVSAANNTRSRRPVSLASVGRSASPYALRSSATCSLVVWSAPDWRYHEPAGRPPARSHRTSSFTCVPEESPRETNGPAAAAMRRNASAALDAAAIRAGSAAGPTMATPVAPNEPARTACPGTTSRRCSRLGTCVITTSTSPRAAAARIWPEGPTTTAGLGCARESSSSSAPDCSTVYVVPSRSGGDELGPAWQAARRQTALKHFTRQIWPDESRKGKS